MRKNGYATRLGPSAVVYTSAVMEYLAHAMLDSAVEETTKGNRKRVSARDLMYGIHNDDDIQRAFSDVHIVGGGVPSTAKAFRASKKVTLLKKKEKLSAKRAAVIAKRKAEKAEKSTTSTTSTPLLVSSSSSSS